MEAEGAARAEELGAQIAMTLYVFWLEARALGGEAVGPAQDGELLPEGTGGAGEPLGRVVGAVVLHEAYLQVERGEGSREVGEGCGEAEPAAYPPDEPGAYGVVGDEEHPALQFAAGDGLGDVVERCGEAEAIDALSPDAGTQPVLFQLALHAAHDLQGVIKGVEVVVGALFDTL